MHAEVGLCYEFYDILMSSLLCHLCTPKTDNAHSNGNKNKLSLIAQAERNSVITEICSIGVHLVSYTLLFIHCNKNINNNK